MISHQFYASGGGDGGRSVEGGGIGEEGDGNVDRRNFSDPITNILKENNHIVSASSSNFDFNHNDYNPLASFPNDVLPDGTYFRF